MELMGLFVCLNNCFFGNSLFYTTTILSRDDVFSGKKKCYLFEGKNKRNKGINTIFRVSED